MDQGILGVDHDFYYTAKNFKPSQVVVSKLRGPTGVKSTLVVTEVADVDFVGLYKVTISTAPSDLEGQYIIAFYEGTHRFYQKITFKSQILSGGSDIRRNGFTEILVSKNKSINMEISSVDTEVVVSKVSNVVMKVNDDVISIGSDGNNASIGV